MQAYLLTEQAGMNVKVGAFPGGGTEARGRAVIRASRRTRVMANKVERGTEVYKTYIVCGMLVCTRTHVRGMDNVCLTGCCMEGGWGSLERGRRHFSSLIPGQQYFDRMRRSFGNFARYSSQLVEIVCSNFTTEKKHLR